MELAEIHSVDSLLNAAKTNILFINNNASDSAFYVSGTTQLVLHIQQALHLGYHQT